MESLKSGIFNLQSLAGVAVALLFLGCISPFTFVDVDLWHEMALFREALLTGSIPLDDHFAYTPTIVPSVQHEWGTGTILYLVAVSFGAPGIMALKYLLTAMTVTMCYVCARRQGSSAEVFFSIAPLVLIPMCSGFTTIRAQVFTLFFLALLFLCLDQDRGRLAVREVRTSWLFLWLPAYTLWLNLHAGFVVGLGLFGLHMLEQALRRRPVKHLLVAAMLMVLLVFVNPYGWHYPVYLWNALSMDRSMITEWQPVWSNLQANATLIVLFLTSVGLVFYAGWVRGFTQLPGLLMVFACTCAASRHFRHLSLFAIAWLCFAPAYLDGTRLGDTIRAIWTKQKAFMAVFWMGVAIFGATQAVHNHFWELRVPFRDTPQYPVGAVNYLDEHSFQGNVVVPFEMGAYVSWKLYPAVRVSIDSRFEVAYQPGVLEEHMVFFSGQPGWREFLRKYPTDALLLYRDKPIVRLLMEEPDWPVAYQDDLFVLFARPELYLPKVDRRGENMTGTFP